MKINTLVSIGSIAVSSIALNFSLIQKVQAVSLLQNGGFVPSNVAQSAYLGNTPASGGLIVNIPSWSFSPGSGAGSRNGYNFITPDGTAFKTNIAAEGNAPYGSLSLYGGNTQTVNSPTGSGWFIAADSAFEQGTINQLISGLSVGQEYIVTFYQAAAQQSGFEGNTTNLWAVNFGGTFNGSGYIPPYTNAFTGGTTQYSTLMSNVSKAPVSDWTKQTLSFTANAPSQLLSFLAEGTPDGQPPFALLSGVSVEAVPEPLTIIGTAIGGIAAFQIRKKLKSNSK